MYLVKIRLQEMHSLAVLQQSWPILLVELLLPQNKAHIGARCMRLGVLDIDLSVEFKLNVIGSFLGFASAGEGEAGGFEIDLGFVGIRCANRKVNVISLRVTGRRALSPGDCGLSV